MRIHNKQQMYRIETLCHQMQDVLISYHAVPKSEANQFAIDGYKARYERLCKELKEALE